MRRSRLALPLVACAMLIAGAVAESPAYAASANQSTPTALTPGNDLIGALFYTQGHQVKQCAAVSVESPGKGYGIIETARQCLDEANRGSIYFFPDYTPGSAPKGHFQVLETFYSSPKSFPGEQWDAAFAVVGKNGSGVPLNRVGQYDIEAIKNLTSISGTANLAYYTSTNHQTACTNRAIKNYSGAPDTWQMNSCVISSRDIGSPLLQQWGAKHTWEVVGVATGSTGAGGLDAIGHYNEASAWKLFSSAWQWAER